MQHRTRACYLTKPLTLDRLSCVYPPWNEEGDAVVPKSASGNSDLETQVPHVDSLLGRVRAFREKLSLPL